jgi:hypothetical protein
MREQRLFPAVKWGVAPAPEYFIGTVDKITVMETFCQYTLIINAFFSEEEERLMEYAGGYDEESK